MIDERERFERAFERFPMPEPSWDRLLRRRDRKRRNQRITAGVVGIAFFLLAVLVVRSGLPFHHAVTPVAPGISPSASAITGSAYIGPPTYTLGPVSDEDVAVGESFMEAWVAGDGDAAAAMFSPDGNFDGFQPTILPALHDWFRAEGWTFGGGDCGIHGWDATRGVVGCGFTYENDLTRGLGMPSVENSLSFVIHDGAIETAWYGTGGDAGFEMLGGYRGWNDALRPVWESFLDWISSSHPDDLVRLYDADHRYPILDPTSIELWRRYTGEFLASPEAQALAGSIRDAGWDGVGIPPEGTAPSLPVEGELVDSFVEFRVGFVFVYADGRVISHPSLLYGGGDTIDERLLTPDGVELVRSGAVEPRMFLPPYLWADLPDGAWADHESTPYVPSRYAVCYYQESGDANPGSINGGYEYPSTVLRFLPARAREILTDREHTYGRGEDAMECSEVTTDEARALDAILSGLTVEDAEGDEIYVEIDELMPHDEWVPKVDG